MKPTEVIKIVDDAMNMLYKNVVNYVAEHQGDKGFILTENYDNGKDTIWATRCYSGGEMEELHVKAVRVINGTLEIIIDTCSTFYTDADIIEEQDDCEWHAVKGDDYIYYYQTLYQIASYIEQYV